MATLDALWRDFCSSYPTPSAHPYGGGETWNQWCGSAMNRFCGHAGHEPDGDISSAWTVWMRTPTGGTDPGSAPPGAFHFWDIGGPSNGHVGVDLDGGGRSVGMATRSLAEELGVAIGINSVNGYSAASGARYVGWCETYANGDVSDFDLGGGRRAGRGTNFAYGLTNEAVARSQAALKQLGYLPDWYIVDGVAGSVFVGGDPRPGGMQQYVKDRGFLESDYAVDGVPGPNYGLALQELAQADGGYTGLMNGAPAQLTSAGIIVWADGVLAVGGTPPEPPAARPVTPTLPAVPSGTVVGIDVATSQAGFDFAAFARGGGAAAIVKMGGSNASDSPYEAPRYREQLEAARAAGLLVGHYWFNGAANALTPETSAEWFAQRVDLRTGEVIAIDLEDEPDTGTVRWSPEEARRFSRRVQEFFPAVRILHYMSRSEIAADDWQGAVDDGHPLWVAMYGANDGNVPVDPPVVEEFGAWAVWQFSSSTPAPGSPWDETSQSFRPVDLNAVRSDAWARYAYVPQPELPPRSRG